MEALEGLKKKLDAQTEEVLLIKKLIGEAYSTIDKVVKADSLHKNIGAHIKRRFAHKKKVVEIRHG